jgi:hypothetical protein
MAQRNCEFLSFSVKYQCPDAGVARLDNSPSTATEEKLLSNSVRAILLRLLTLITAVVSSWGWR